MADGHVVVQADEVCSLIEQPEESIKFFKTAEAAYADGNGVTYNLENTVEITETFTAFLISQIKDRNINQGRLSKVTFPENAECSKKLKKLGIFKKVGSSSEEVELDSIPVQKLSNLQVANDIAKELVKTSAFILYGEEKRIKELYAILIEIMANTNNHAAADKKAKYPWWLFTFYDEDRDVIKFFFLDHGIGIFESLPVKQFMIRNPQPIFSNVGTANTYRRGLQLSEIFSNLTAGKIKSSTGKPMRGRGLPLVASLAKTDNFNQFVIISNDAYIDVIAEEVSTMNEFFSGTLFYFELKRATS